MLKGKGKRIFCRSASLLLMAALMLALCACGKKSSSSGASAKAASPTAAAAPTSAPQKQPTPSAAPQIPEVHAEGTVDQIHWSLDGTTLTFSGEGSLRAMTQHDDPCIICYHYMNDSTEQLLLTEGDVNTEVTVTRIVFGEGITEIGDGSFSNWPDLQEIQFPSSLSSIGKWCFHSCPSVKSVVLPDGLERIDEFAFYGCGVTEVVLPDSVTSVGDQAFEACDLQRAVLGAGLGVVKFRSESLTDIQVSGSNPNIVSYDGILYSKDMTEVLYCPHGKETAILPEGVTVIGYAAFENCDKLQQVVIPDTVTAIKQLAFHGCYSLTELRLPASVTEIRSDAFKGKLTKVYYAGTEEQWNAISGIRSAGFPKDVVVIYESP